MKKYLALLFVFTLIVYLLCSCTRSIKCYPSSTPQISSGTVMPQKNSVSFQETYTYTAGGYVPDEVYPRVILVSSVKELIAYREANSDKYNFTYAHDHFPSFDGAITKYDEKFFDTHRLILVLLEETSGSRRHNITSFTTSPQGNEIQIERYFPYGGGTADMAMWHILIEVEKDALLSQEFTVIPFERYPF